MKKAKLLTACMAIGLIALSNGVNAQLYKELDPASLDPDPNGWFLAGGDKDGTHYDSCSTEYGGSNHSEADTQQNFIYKNAIVMPECWPLDATNDNSVSNVNQGYIQLGKTKYSLSAGEVDDSSHLCYVISPEISYLDSIHLEISPDVTPQSGRVIGLQIEYSSDGGKTWSDKNDEVFMDPQTTDKKGTVWHLNSQDADFGLPFKDFVSESNKNPILIRFLSYDNSYAGGQGSQRVKIHNIKIYYNETSAIGNTNIEENKILVNDRTISAKDGSKVTVYNYMGQTIGTGNTVAVKTGVYIVHTETGATQKVMVR